jgi:hypothetical protein
MTLLTAWASSFPQATSTMKADSSPNGALEKALENPDRERDEGLKALSFGSAFE